MPSSSLTIPLEDQASQAVAGLRGYVYQAWVSAIAWTRLRPGETLLLEVADDYATLSAGALDLSQVKDTAASGSVTLRDPGVVAAINRLWRFRQANPGLEVSLAFLTTASPGRERGLPFPGGVPGLVYWRTAARDGTDLGPLRGALAQLPLAEDLKAWLEQADDAALRATLLRPLRFACAEPALPELEVLLEDSLAHLCSTAGARGADVRSLRNGLLIEVLRTAVLPDAEMRRLDRDQLIARILEAATPGFPDLGGGSLSGVLDPIDGPAGDRNLIGRPEATQALADRLASGRGWLYGPSGIGKSALARTLAVGANRPWYSLDLRDLTGRAVATRLRAARQALFATDVWGGLVVEDLNTIPGGSVKRELALLFEQARLEDARVLVTAYAPPPPSVTAELDINQDAVAASPRFTEAETAALVVRAGGDPETWARPIHLFSGVGYPQLIAARISALGAAAWPREELGRMLEPGAGVGVEAEMDGLRRQLIADLPPGASSLLFRVSLLVGAFDRDMAVRLGEATPAIAEPGAVLDLLTGPWLEPAADGRLRISPVLSGAGLKVLSESEQTRFHEAIAEFLAARRPVRTGDLPQLVLSGLRTGSQKALGLVARLALGGQLPDSVLGRGLYPLAFMKTDAPLSDQLMINAPLRAAQVKVAALNGMARPAIEAFRALERETPDDEVGGVFRSVTVFSLLTGPLELSASDWLPLVLNIPVDAVDRTTALLAKAEAELAQQAGGASPEDAGGSRAPGFDALVRPVTDFGAFLFTFRAHKMLGLEDLESLIDQLEVVEPGRRNVLLAGEGLNRHSDNRQTLVQNAWLAETRREDFNARSAADRLDRLGQRLSAWPDPVFAREAHCARIVMLSEYAGAPLEALAMVEAALEGDPTDARMRRERVKILIQLKRFEEVAADSVRLLEDMASGDRVEQVFAARDVAIAIAETGNLAAAADQFEAAATIAMEGVSLGTLALTLEADAILLRWRLGARGAALDTARNLLERADATMPDLTDESRADLGRGLYAMAEVFHQDMTAPGWDKGLSMVGVASRGGAKDGDALAPVPMTAWYRLAEVESALGLDVGLERGLQARRAGGVLTAFEIVRLGRGSWDGIGSADPEIAAAAVVERGRGWAWLRTMPASERDTAAQMSTLVPEVPWAGDLDLTNANQRVYAAQALTVALALALARGEADGEARLAASSNAETSGLAALIAGLPAVSASVEAYGPDLSALWAIRRLAADDYDVGELFVITAHLTHWVSQISGGGAVATAVGPVLARCWRQVATERSFSLTAPALARPAILQATLEVRSLRGLARLLVAAHPWVSVRVAPDTVGVWREQALTG